MHSERLRRELVKLGAAVTVNEYLGLHMGRQGARRACPGCVPVPTAASVSARDSGSSRCLHARRAWLPVPPDDHRTVDSQHHVRVFAQETKTYNLCMCSARGHIAKKKVRCNPYEAASPIANKMKKEREELSGWEVTHTSAAATAYALEVVSRVCDVSCRVARSSQGMHAAIRACQGTHTTPCHQDQTSVTIVHQW